MTSHRKSSRSVTANTAPALPAMADAADEEPENLAAQIAEAAYFLAQQRGFEPGYAVADWLAAEARIKLRYGRLGRLAGDIHSGD